MFTGQGEKLLRLLVRQTTLVGQRAATLFIHVFDLEPKWVSHSANGSFVNPLRSLNSNPTRLQVNSLYPLNTTPPVGKTLLIGTKVWQINEIKTAINQFINHIQRRFQKWHLDRYWQL